MTERETEAEREIREQRWKGVGERSREGEGGEQNKMEHARKMEIKNKENDDKRHSQKSKE